MNSCLFIGQDDGKVVATRRGEPDRVISTSASEPDARYLASMMNHAYRTGVLDTLDGRKAASRKPWFSLNVELGRRTPKS